MTHHARLAVNQLAAFYGIDAFENRHGQLVVRETDFARLEQQVHVAKAYGLTSGELAGQRPWLGVPIVSAPDWTFDPYLLATARMLATFRRHRWFRALCRILGDGRGSR